MTQERALDSALMPLPHISALKEIERGYWWYVGRLYWAKELAAKAILASPQKKLRYADLGCGTGGFATELHRHFHFSKAILADGDPHMVDIAGAHSELEARLIDFSIDFRLPWRANLITCMDVTEHIENDRRFLKQIGENLEHGGHLILSVPQHPALYSEWDRRLGHHRRYTTSALRRLLTESGFEIRQIKSMWNALTLPTAIVRKFFPVKSDEGMTFQKVSPLINSLLTTYSRLEWALTEVLPVRLGTSLIVLAEKP